MKMEPQSTVGFKLLAKTLKMKTPLLGKGAGNAVQAAFGG